MKAILLAGGKGTRLWPISKSTTPKQMVSPLKENKNLLEYTIDRTLNLGFKNEDMFLVTTQEQENMLQSFWVSHNLNKIIAEPQARNTAPAILLAVKQLMQLNIDPNESIYIFPSDHYITDFKIDFSIDLSQKILCFRIIPTRPETGYGYIQVENNNPLTKVKRFVEKPDMDTAQSWYNDWKQQVHKTQTEKFFWNSGIYGFSINSLSSALKQIDPTLHQLWKNSSYEKFSSLYDQLPKQSFDTLIAEQAPNLYSVLLNASNWRDLGTWESIYDALNSDNSDDDNINIGSAQFITINSTKSCLLSSDQNINVACAGVENLAIVISGQNILIVDKKNPQAMQDLINKLQNEYKDLI